MTLTPEQLQVLHDDIVTNNLFDFVAMTPDGFDYIAGYYNTLAASMAGPVLIADVLIWAAQENRYAKLLAGVDAPGTIGSICQIALVTLNNSQVPNLDLGDPTIAGLFEALVNAEILTAQDQAAIQALAVRPISRAQALLGVPRITYVDVGQARALP